MDNSWSFVFKQKNSSCFKFHSRSFRFQVHIFASNIKSRATGLLFIQITVPHNQRFRITFMQFLKQPSQRTLLCLRPCVARSLAVTGKTSYICNTNRMSVMIPAMRTDLFFRSTPFNSAVGRNNIMISTTLPAQRAVVAVNVRHSQCAASAVSAAMHNNQSYRSHKSTNQLPMVNKEHELS